MTDCALYYGWYTGAVAGPFTQPDFRFVPGAIAVHIHSFSAATLRDPNGGWVGPLLTKGAAASLGNVYEPYLQFTAHLDMFNDRLLHGFTFAESAYMSMRALSWMSVMVGDPLYRPYASWNQIDLKQDASKTASPWQMEREFTIKNSSKPTAEFRTLARQAASRAQNCPMIEDLGAQEAQDGNFASAASYFQQARACYTKRDDILRVVLEEADTLIKENKPKRALELVRSVLRIISDAPASALLKKVERELAPPPTPSQLRRERRLRRDAFPGRLILMRHVRSRTPTENSARPTSDPVFISLCHPEPRRRRRTSQESKDNNVWHARWRA